MQSAPHGNNKMVAFAGKPLRERPPAQVKAMALRERGIISEKQMRRLRQSKDK